MIVPSAWTAAQAAWLRAHSSDPAFAPVLATASAALSRQPQPLERIAYEGRLPMDPDRVRHNHRLQDLGVIRCLVLAEVATDEAAYGRQALVWTQAWMNTYRPTGNAINDNKVAQLVGAWGWLRMRVDAAARGRGDGWVRQLAEAQIRSSQDPKAPQSNWQSKRIRLVAAAATTLGDDTLARWAENRFAAYIDVELFADGSSRDFTSRDALSYHCSGLAPLLELALLAGDQGRSWYTRRGRQGGSLEASIAFLVDWVAGDKRHPEWVHTTATLDRERAKAGVPHYQPGRLFQPDEALPTLRLAAPLDPSLPPIIAHIRGDASRSWQDLLLDARAAH
jgi:hypothetical protein